MAKSEAITACLPSTPEIPIPTSAVWIIETSLAPSPKNYQGMFTNFFESSHEFVRRIPMPRVRMCSCCLTIFTINAFWSGVALQHKTAAQWRVKWRNGFCRFERLSSIYLCEFERRLHSLCTCYQIVQLTTRFFHQQPKPFVWPPCWNCRRLRGKRNGAYFRFHWHSL